MLFSINYNRFLPFLMLQLFQQTLSNINTALNVLLLGFPSAKGQGIYASSYSFQKKEKTKTSV